MSAFCSAALRCRWLLSKRLRKSSHLLVQLDAAARVCGRGGPLLEQLPDLLAAARQQLGRLGASRQERLQVPPLGSVQQRLGSHRGGCGHSLSGPRKGHHDGFTAAECAACSWEDPAIVQQGPRQKCAAVRHASMRCSRMRASTGQVLLLSSQQHTFSHCTAASSCCKVNQHLASVIAMTFARLHESLSMAHFR